MYIIAILTAMKTKRFGTYGIAIALTVAAKLAGTDASAQTDNTGTNVDLPALLQRLDQLEQQVKVLQRNREVDQEAATEKAKALPTVTLGGDGLVIRSGDSNFTSFIHGYAQVDGRFYTGDNNAATDGFLLRRVRPIMEGTVYKYFDYRLMADFGTGNGSGSTALNNALLDDAYVNARFWRQIQFQAGKFKSPVGLERLESTSDLQFIETGYATALTPNYDTGFMIHNNLFTNIVGYAVGVFDGAPDGGSLDAGSGEGKDAVARLFLQPFITTRISPLQHLGFGVAGSVGDHTGALPSYKTPGQQTFYSYAAGVTADGEQFRLDPQGYYFWGPFGVQGEYVLSSQKVKSTTVGVPDRRLNNRAWQVQASYFLTGEENTFKPSSLVRVAPLRPFSLANGMWGAFEVAARYQELLLDPAAFPTYALAGSAQKAASWGAGFNWYLNRNLKVNLNYETTRFENGSTTPGAVTAKPERAVLTQVQVAF